MLNLLSWFKPHTKKTSTPKIQKFVEVRRGNSSVTFIYPGHPLYDNIVDTEKNQTKLLAPNDAAYSETSLINNFVAIVIYNKENYLVVNSVKHFKEQSIGGLLQFDENIYQVIPFFEDEEEYQTAADYTFNETYEYDHPVESYAFITGHNGNTIKITTERGKKPTTVQMIDNRRELFTEKLPKEQIDLIDYTVIPAIKAYIDIQERRKSKHAS